MIIVVAQISFPTQSARDETIELATPVQLATREQEPGCHAYCFSADPCVPTLIQVYELWEDSDSLAAHFRHSNYQDMLDILLKTGFLGSVNRAHLTERDEPVYGPNNEFREAFFE